MEAVEEILIKPSTTMTDSDVDLLFKTSNRSLSMGSENNQSGCPPGLRYLLSTNALFLKPYSGPLMIGNFSVNKSYEVLNANGKRIFMICNSKETSRKWSFMEDESNPNQKYRVKFIVYNHAEEEVFTYFGTPGENIKVGPIGTLLHWGEVKKIVRSTSCCPFSRTKKLHFSVITETWGRGGRKKGFKADQDLIIDNMYSIDGIMKLSFFPTESTDKLYYGTFDYVISSLPVDGELNGNLVGEMKSSLVNERLGTSLPGILFPKDISVYHKAVLFGALLVDVIL